MLFGGYEPGGWRFDLSGRANKNNGLRLCLSHFVGWLTFYAFPIPNNDRLARAATWTDRMDRKRACLSFILFSVRFSYDVKNRISKAVKL